MSNLLIVSSSKLTREYDLRNPLVGYERPTADQRIRSPSSSATLYEAPEFVSTIIDTHFDFVFLVSIRGVFLYLAKKPCMSLLEYSPDDLLGHNLQDFLHPSDKMALFREMKSCGHDRFSSMCRFRKKVSGYVYLEIIGHLYEEPIHKKVKCFVLSGRKVDTGLYMYTGNILDTSESTGQGWLRVSPEGLVLHCDSSCQVFFGVTPQALVSESIFKYVHPDDTQGLRLILGTMNWSGHMYVECRCRLNNGVSWNTLCFRIHVVDHANIESFYIQIKTQETNQLTLHQFGHLFDNGNILDIVAPTKAANIGTEVNAVRIFNKKLRDELAALLN